MDSGGHQASTISQRLLLSLAEQMKLPLLQITRQAEIGSMGLAGNYHQIQTLAQNALDLIDSYSLSVQLYRQYGYELAPEAISVASVLYDADQQLKSLAEAYNVQLELKIDGKYGPVLAHKRGLQSAIVGLASAIIEALPAHSETERPSLQLAAHRCRYGIVAGVYANIPGLSSDALKRGRRLYGTSRQPIVDLSHTSGAGIFVADAIFRSMRLKLHVSKYKHLYGLGVILKPSLQLSLI